MALDKLTRGQFEREVVNGTGRVVVDFFAEWCGPCRQVAPELEALAAKWGAAIRFVKLDIDEYPDVAHKYGIFSIPTIVLFVDGEVAGNTLGVRPAQVIEHDLGLPSGQVA